VFCKCSSIEKIHLLIHSDQFSIARLNWTNRLYWFGQSMGLSTSKTIIRYFQIDDKTKNYILLSIIAITDYSITKATVKMFCQFVLLFIGNIYGPLQPERKQSKHCPVATIMGGRSGFVCPSCLHIWASCGRKGLLTVVIPVSQSVGRLLVLSLHLSPVRLSIHFIYLSLCHAQL
jgi:hypothetical protein